MHNLTNFLDGFADIKLRVLDLKFSIFNTAKIKSVLHYILQVQRCIVNYIQILLSSRFFDKIKQKLCHGDNWVKWSA